LTRTEGATLSPSAYDEKTEQNGREKTESDWVTVQHDKWKEQGFKVQAAARFLIRRLGYDILKAEEDLPTPTQMPILERKLGPHLARHSDYVVRMGRRLYVIDVKAKELAYLLKQKQRYHQFNQSIFLKRHYVESVVPVLVLVVLYPGVLFGSSSARDEKVYYTMLSGSSGKETRTADGGIEIMLDHGLDSYQWIRARTFRKWMRVTRRSAHHLIRMCS
jgi:hypothetical protein